MVLFSSKYWVFVKKMQHFDFESKIKIYIYNTDFNKFSTLNRS